MVDVIYPLNPPDLFNNPLAQEPEYRQYVIHHVPSVQLLDRRGGCVRDALYHR